MWQRVNLNAGWYYLRPSGTPLGRLTNFNAVPLKDGVTRVLNPTGSWQRER
jgi:hypothetical protein